MCVYSLDMSTDETVKATINAICGARGLSLAELGAAVGIPKASMYYKMGHGFYFREVTSIADHLGISVEDLKEGRVDVLALAFGPRATTNRYLHNRDLWALAA